MIDYYIPPEVALETTRIDYQGQKSKKKGDSNTLVEGLVDRLLYTSGGSIGDGPSGFFLNIKFRRA